MCEHGIVQIFIGNDTRQRLVNFSFKAVFFDQLTHANGAERVIFFIIFFAGRVADVIDCHRCGCKIAVSSALKKLNQFFRVVQPFVGVYR